MKKGDKAQSLSPFFRFWPQLLRKQCDRVKYLHIFPSFLQSRRDMQRAADIQGDQRAGLRGERRSST
jgi:hypothetical protein